MENDRIFLGDQWIYEMTVRDLLATSNGTVENTKSILTELVKRIRDLHKQCRVPRHRTGLAIANRLERLAASDLCDARYANSDLALFWDWANDAQIWIK